MELNPIALRYIFDQELFYFPEEKIAPTTKNGIIGRNLKKISIISATNLNPTETALLEKILVALQLTFDDISLFTHQNQEATLLKLQTTTPSSVITFGVSPFEFGIKDIALQDYEIKETPEFKILQAEKFELYLARADKKKALWFALQKLFG